MANTKKSVTCFGEVKNNFGNFTFFIQYTKNHSPQNITFGKSHLYLCFLLFHLWGFFPFIKSKSENPDFWNCGFYLVAFVKIWNTCFYQTESGFDSWACFHSFQRIFPWSALLFWFPTCKRRFALQLQFFSLNFCGFVAFWNHHTTRNPKWFAKNPTDK